MDNKFVKGAYVLSLVTLMALTGCGQTNAPTSGAAASPKSAPAASGATAANAPSASPADAKPKAPLIDLTVATILDTAQSGPIYYAIDKGIFEKYGLNVKRASLDVPSAVASIISGDAQIVMSGPGIVDAALKTNKVRVIGSHGQSAMWVYSKNLNKMEELKGKTLAASSPGGGVDYAARTLIPTLGLQQNKDVKVLYAGSNPAILASINEGKVDAGILMAPMNFQADQMGLKNLGYLNDIKGVQGRFGIMGMHVPFAEKNPQAIGNFFKAYSESVKLMQKDKEGSKAVLQKYTRVTDDKTLDQTYEAFKDIWPTTPNFIPKEEIQFALETLAETNPDAKGKKPSDVMDSRYDDVLK